MNIGRKLTPVEIRRDILLPNIGCHGDDGNVLSMNTNHCCRGHAVQVRHDDVHEDQVIAVAILVDLIHGFESIFLWRTSVTCAPRTKHTTHRCVYSAIHMRQKFGAYPGASWVVFDKENDGLLGPERSFLGRRGCLLAVSHSSWVAQRPGVRNVVDVVGVEGIDAGRLPHWVDHMPHLSEWIMEHGHGRCGMRKHDRRGGRVGRRSRLMVGNRQPFEFPVRLGIWRQAVENFPRTPQLSRRLIGPIGQEAKPSIVVRWTGMARMTGMRRMSTISPPVIQCGEMGYHLGGHLALRLDHLLQTHNLVDKYLVGLGQLEELLLQRLDLVLSGYQGLAKDSDLLTCRKSFLYSSCLPRRRCFPADVIQVVFPVCAKFRMAELPGLRPMSVLAPSGCDSRHIRRDHKEIRRSPRCA